MKYLIEVKDFDKYYVLADLNSRSAFRLCDLRLFDSIESATVANDNRFNIISASILFRRNIIVKSTDKDSELLIVDFS